MDDFRIQQRLGSSIGARKDGQFSRLNISSSLAPSFDTVSIQSTREQRAGHYLFISNINSAAEIAKQATEEIASLREEQVELAYEASQTQQGSRISDLNTRSQELETEIARITQNATFNGTNVLQGATFTISIDEIELHDAISFPNATPATANPGITYTSQSEAETAYTSFQEAADKAYQIRDAFDTVAEKVSDLLDKTSLFRSSDLSAVQSESEARDLAKDIAYQIGSPFSSEFAFQDLIEATLGALDQEASKKLLSEN